ncbi:SNF2 domain-containing protein CLASSY 1-like [Iris pallida]|uniref:SNF2 domain-containing protein CLASSY 1-like n=1 Tax=Iris pallida TaxID=29817 RepID=A0AAX6FF04_IRIPA|nr:SNF2 domain-containing protein CLASSY 1-like [Iris pallida]
MTKQPFLRRKHPIDSIPFEAFYYGSWHGVDLVSIRDGKMFIQLRYDGSIIEDTICGDYIRPRSRKASTFDCLHFLKTGVDVCVRSARPITDQEPEEPLWHDAKIISIKGDHYQDRCTCLFSVAFNKNGSLADKLKNTSVTEVVNIDNLAILQKLHCEPCEDGFHQWTSTEDCVSASRSKLLSGTISSEISWLIVLSTLRGTEFNIDLVQNKILYHILNDVQGVSNTASIQSNGDVCVTSPASGEEIKVMRFRRCDEIVRPKVGTFTIRNSEENNLECRAIEVEEDPLLDVVDCDSEVEILYDSASLRRSKRRKTLPDRFTSYSSPNFDRCPPKKLVDDLGRIIENSAYTEPSSPREKEPYEQNLMHKISNSMDHETFGTNSVILQLDDQLDRTQPSFIMEVEDICEFPERKVQGGLKLKKSCSKFKKGGNSPPSYKTNHFSWTNQYKYPNRKKLLSSMECEELIKRCMRNIEAETEFPLQPDSEWADSQTKLLVELQEFKWSPDDDPQIKTDENEDLWKEMEHSLSTLALLEQKRKLEPEHNEATDAIDKDGKKPCQHDCKFNEQIGMTCQLCNLVCTEIRDIAPRFFRTDGWTSSLEKVERNTLQWMKSCTLESGSFDDAVPSLEMSPSEPCENVWALIPDLRSKLHSHQKKAFEFIWGNIAGSLKPEEMNNLSEITGGCVISHSPGSGKTLLMISFLVSYLKLFSRSRPLILAPKIAVYIWCKEFEKWGISIPLHVIHPVESFKNKTWDPKLFAAGDRRPSLKVMQVMDCLLKLKQWHEKPSVLLMSYSTFFALSDEKSKNECRRFMADLLRDSPGILILDEGHNPRSTRSKLRKLLMKVNTESRVLLSGTLFQNNFEEYFNTLSLARPRFVDDVIRKLDRNMFNILCGRNQKGDKRKNRKERLARKRFIEEIGQKIESSAENERSQGFNLLNRTTSQFIDVYEGAICDQLPGLHVYTLMLTSSDVQREILKKLQNSIIHKRCPLELELLIQVGSMHPWLIKTIGRVGDYFSIDELDNLESYKKKFQSGSKVKFVIELVQKCTIRGEKVLIFCHNISPINFLVELFGIVFGWSRGEDVLVLQGDQELSERAMIMDKFNGDSGNKYKVLIASTLACAEGISLIAASRVVLLDSEWNHSKTRQAIARAFRLGQERVVYVYRLLALGTWEEDKYHSNEWKAWLSKMIFLGRYIKFSSSRHVDHVDVEDEILKELVEEDPTKTIQLIMKQE